MAARKHAERGPPPRVKSRDPAIAGDAHQAIGGEQQPGLGQADAEIGVIQRQQQIEQRVPGLRQGESERGVPGIAVRCLVAAAGPIAAAGGRSRHEFCLSRLGSSSPRPSRTG